MVYVGLKDKGAAPVPRKVKGAAPFAEK
jgi:hypothetical protein